MTVSALSLLLLGILAAPPAIRYVEWRRRVRARKAMFARAEQRAKETGRQLVVIGDPDGGVTHGDYGYGDVCIDLVTGCEDGPIATVKLKTDISKPIPLDSDRYVVFMPYVLELVPEIEKAWAEVLRITGGPENVFMLALHPNELATYSYAFDKASARGSEVCYAITSMPPDGPLVYTKLDRSRYFARRL